MQADLQKHDLPESTEKKPESTPSAPRRTKKQAILEKMTELDKKQRTVHVSNIPADITLVQLRHAFGTIGTVLSIQILPGPEYAFRGEDKEAILIYDRLSEVNNCVTYLDGVRIKDHFLSVYQDSDASQFLKTQGIVPLKDRQKCTVYVGSIDYTITSEVVKNIFSSFGPINYCRMIMDNATGTHKGFGFIEFAAPESAAAAIQEMNGQQINGRPIKVKYATTCIVVNDNSNN